MTDARQRAEETVTDQAIALQGEMDLTLLELLIEVDSKTNRVAEDSSPSCTCSTKTPSSLALRDALAELDRIARKMAI